MKTFYILLANLFFAFFAQSIDAMDTPCVSPLREMVSSGNDCHPCNECNPCNDCHPCNECHPSESWDPTIKATSITKTTSPLRGLPYDVARYALSFIKDFDDFARLACVSKGFNEMLQRTDVLYTAVGPALYSKLLDAITPSHFREWLSGFPSAAKTWGSRYLRAIILHEMAMQHNLKISETGKMYGLLCHVQEDGTAGWCHEIFDWYGILSEIKVVRDLTPRELERKTKIKLFKRAVVRGILSMSRKIAYRRCDILLIPENIHSVFVQYIEDCRKSYKRLKNISGNDFLEHLQDEITNNNFDIDFRSRKNEDTLLHNAMKNCWSHVVDTLIEAGADITIRTQDGTDLFGLAVSSGCTEFALKFMQNHNAKECNTADRYGWTPLQEACAKGHIEIAWRLIDMLDAKQYNVASWDIYTPLAGAAYNGHTILVSKLAEKLTQEECCVADRFDKETPLHRAARRGHLIAASILIKKLTPEQCDMPNKNGQTPLWQTSNTGIALLLVEKLTPEQCNAVMPWGDTKLLHSAKWGHEEVAQAIREKLAYSAISLDKILMNQGAYEAGLIGYMRWKRSLAMGGIAAGAYCLSAYFVRCLG